MPEKAGMDALYVIVAVLGFGAIVYGVKRNMGSKPVDNSIPEGQSEKSLKDKKIYEKSLSKIKQRGIDFHSNFFKVSGVCKFFNEEEKEYIAPYHANI